MNNEQFRRKKTAERISRLELETAAKQDLINRLGNSVRMADEKIQRLEAELAKLKREVGASHKENLTLLNTIKLQKHKIISLTKCQYTLREENAELRTAVKSCNDTIKMQAREKLEMMREVERLEHHIHVIHATEESYDDEQTVLCEIYQHCRDAKGGR